MGSSICSAQFEGVIWSIFRRGEDDEQYSAIFDNLENYDDFDLKGWTFRPECAFSDDVESELCGAQFSCVKGELGIDFVNTHPMEAARGDVDLAAAGSLDSLEQFLVDFSDLDLSHDISENEIITKEL
jgi:hypothetical protein